MFYYLVCRGEGNVLEPTDITGYLYIKAVERARHIATKIGCDWDALTAYNERYFQSLATLDHVPAH